MEAVNTSPTVEALIPRIEGELIHWTMTARYELLPDDAHKAQREAGYCPNGYGFFGFKCHEEPQGTYMATWRCSSVPHD